MIYSTAMCIIPYETKSGRFLAVVDCPRTTTWQGSDSNLTASWQATYNNMSTNWKVTYNENKAAYQFRHAQYEQCLKGDSQGLRLEECDDEDQDQHFSYTDGIITTKIGGEDRCFMKDGNYDIILGTTDCRKFVFGNSFIELKDAKIVGSELILSQGSYKIGREIGHGSHAQVYKVRDSDLILKVYRTNQRETSKYNMDMEIHALKKLGYYHGNGVFREVSRQTRAFVVISRAYTDILTEKMYFKSHQKGIRFSKFLRALKEARNQLYNSHRMTHGDLHPGTTLPSNFRVNISGNVFFNVKNGHITAALIDFEKSKPFANLAMSEIKDLIKKDTRTYKSAINNRKTSYLPEIKDGSDFEPRVENKALFQHKQTGLFCLIVFDGVEIVIGMCLAAGTDTEVVYRPCEKTEPLMWYMKPTGINAEYRLQSGKNRKCLSNTDGLFHLGECKDAIKVYVSKRYLSYNDYCITNYDNVATLIECSEQTRHHVLDHPGVLLDW